MRVSVYHRIMVSTLFLEKALETLEEALKEHAQRKDDLLVRDGVIQRFEYCFELAVKTLERMLKEEMVSDSELKVTFYKDLIRIGAAKGLIESPEGWFRYREARNKTSHAYSNAVAEEVFECIGPFLGSAKNLMAHLKSLEQ